MSHDFSELRRRYVRLTEQELERVDRWDLPDVTHDAEVRELSNQSGFYPPHALEALADEAGPEGDDEAENGPVGFTAAELEEIRQAAYEEGLEQGLEEGRASGQQVGYREGLEQGLEEGRQQGHDEGMAKAEQRLGEERLQLQALLNNLAHPSRKLDAELMEQLRQLICQVAEAVLMREVETSQELVLELIHKGLQILPAGNQSIKIYLQREDKQQLEPLWQPDDPELEILLLTDPKMARGDCRLVSGDSQVNFNWQQRLQAVNSQLNGWIINPAAGQPITEPHSEPAELAEPSAQTEPLAQTEASVQAESIVQSEPSAEPAQSLSTQHPQQESADELGQSAVDSVSQAAAQPA